MKHLMIVIFLSLLFSSCVFDHTAVTEDLGNGYYYLGDGHESQILYDPNQNDEKKGGLIVTGSEVVEYNSNSRYIIAKSIAKDEYRFWIIDKKMPRDSIKDLGKQEYETALYLLNINLELKKRK